MAIGQQKIRLETVTLFSSVDIDGRPRKLSDTVRIMLRVTRKISKTENGFFLNTQLAMGRMEQPSIFELSVQWRKYKIAVVADIEKMYKQIMLAEDC